MKQNYFNMYLFVLLVSKYTLPERHLSSVYLNTEGGLVKSDEEKYATWGKRRSGGWVGVGVVLGVEGMGGWMILAGTVVLYQ